MCIHKNPSSYILPRYIVVRYIFLELSISHCEVSVNYLCKKEDLFRSSFLIHFISHLLNPHHNPPDHSWAQRAQCQGSLQLPSWRRPLHTRWACSDDKTWYPCCCSESQRTSEWLLNTGNCLWCHLFWSPSKWRSNHSDAQHCWLPDSKTPLKVHHTFKTPDMAHSWHNFINEIIKHRDGYVRICPQFCF